MSQNKQSVIKHFEWMLKDLSEISELLSKRDVNLASVKFTSFKAHIESLKDTLFGENETLNKWQKDFLLPAVSDMLAWSLTVELGSKNQTAISRSIDEAEDDVNYWFSDLKDADLP